jgi:hypothetical protein
VRLSVQEDICMMRIIERQKSRNPILFLEERRDYCVYFNLKNNTTIYILDTTGKLLLKSNQRKQMETRNENV